MVDNQSISSSHSRHLFSLGMRRFIFADKDNTLPQDFAIISPTSAKFFLRTSPMLFYGVGTVIAALTLLAMASHPHAIELHHGLLHYIRVVGKNARFEVASILTFHAHARPSEVCREFDSLFWK